MLSGVQGDWDRLHAPLPGKPATSVQEYAAQLTGLATASPPTETTDLPQALQPTRMRDAVAFEWPDTLLNSQVRTIAACIRSILCIIPDVECGIMAASFPSDAGNYVS